MRRSRSVVCISYGCSIRARICISGRGLFLDIRAGNRSHDTKINSFPIFCGKTEELIHYFLIIGHLTADAGVQKESIDFYLHG